MKCTPKILRVNREASSMQKVKTYRTVKDLQHFSEDIKLNYIHRKIFKISSSRTGEIFLQLGPKQFISLHSQTNVDVCPC